MITGRCRYQTKCFISIVWIKLKSFIHKGIQTLYRWRYELQKIHTGCEEIASIAIWKCCVRTTEDIHYVDTHWFSHKMMKDRHHSSTKLSLKNSSCNWFAKSKILPPVNIQIVHWVLLVLDLQEKVYILGSKRRISTVDFTADTTISFILIHNEVCQEATFSGGKYVEFRTQISCADWSQQLWNICLRTS